MTPKKILGYAILGSLAILSFAAFFAATGLGGIIAFGLVLLFATMLYLGIYCITDRTS